MNNEAFNSNSNESSRLWVHHAIATIEADFQRSADTHLIALPIESFKQAGIDFYFKDESTHPTGSLKLAIAILPSKGSTSYFELVWLLESDCAHTHALDQAH